MADPSTFALFAETAEAMAATSKRLEKYDRLGAYLAGLGDDDLTRAARWIAGRAFPLRDQRTVSVGTAALLDAVAAAAETTRDALRPRLVALGDPGDVAAEALANRTVAASPVTLADLDRFLADLAGTRGTKAKTALVIDLLLRLSPLEARYLVKLLAGDLRIGLKVGGVEATIGRLHDTSVGAVQRATMLTGDLGETALLARHDRLGEARMRLFHPLGFMLATAAEDADDVARQMPTPFAVEDKYDGIRAQAHVGADPGPDVHGEAVSAARVALFSRTLDGIARAFPDLLEPLAALLDEAPGGVILDGEIVPVAAAAIQPFQALQRRLGRKTVPETLQREVPVAFVVYDALFFDGAVVLETPYAERQALLDRLALPDGETAAPVRRSTVRLLDDPATLDDAFDAARARGNEGLMVKAPGSVYRPGRRGRDWLKLKKALATLDCVVTAVEVGNGRRRHLLSDFTFAVRASESDPTLLNVGKAYSGLTDAELAALTDWFKAHTLQQFAHGKVRLVEPRVVIEVAFDRVQVSKRHKSGFALRFPRIVRLREDKPPEEIDTLAAVRALAEP